MSDDFDGVTPDMIRAAAKRAAAVDADRGVAPVVEEQAEPAPKALKARKQTIR